MNQCRFVGICLLTTLLACANTVGQPVNAGQSDSKQSSKEDDVRELLRATGAAKMGIQMINIMLPNLRKMAPQVPEEFWSSFRKEIDPNELVELVVPLYLKHFTRDEIRGLIKFYHSPLGGRFVSVQPRLTQEAAEAGRKWGRAIGKRVIKKLREQGHFQ